MPRTDLSPHQHDPFIRAQAPSASGPTILPRTWRWYLVRWALADGDGPVLDPSYGGCAFLEAAARVLSERDSSSAGARVYGVDIDPSCADVVRDSELLIEDNCLRRDFLAASSDDLPGGPYAAIVGNPPYVRHHWIGGRSTRVGPRRCDRVVRSAPRDRQPLGLLPTPFPKVPVSQRVGWRCWCRRRSCRPTMRLLLRGDAGRTIREEPSDSHSRPPVCPYRRGGGRALVLRLRPERGDRDASR